jgi:4-amino-4-deoxy-L-arabinose transferase-like glycosyltransferase
MPVRREFLLPLTLILAVVLLFLPPGGLRDWWYPDEPDVALPAIEMQVRADWVVPTHNGSPWLDYPPLAYWGARSVGSITGDVTPWGTRIPMVLFAAVFLLATLWLGRQLDQSQRGVLAGVILVATPTFWFHASNLQVDLGYAAAIALGLAFYHQGESARGRRAWWWRIAAFASFGVAILGKGPLGVLIPGLILTCWHAWNREWRRLLWLAPLALVSLAVASPWYLLLRDRLGTEVVLQELMAQNFDRFVDSKRGHGGKGAFYYLLRLPGDLGLWTLFIVPALWQGFRTCRDDRAWRLLAIWLLAPFIFFTLASTKRNVYLLPVFPAIALLMADWLPRAGTAWESWLKTWGARLAATVLLLAGIGLVLASVVWTAIPVRSRLPREVWEALLPSVLVIGLWLLAAGGWMAWRAFARRAHDWRAMAGTTTIAYVAVMWLTFPVLDRVRSYRPAAQWLVERVPAGGLIGFFSPGRENSKRPAWLCHLEGRRLRFLRSPAEAQSWLGEDPTRLVLSSPTHGASVHQAVVVQSWTISTDAWVVLSKRP